MTVYAYRGVGTRGAGGTFAENLAKLLQNKDFPLKFMSFAPLLLILSYNSYASSNTPDNIVSDQET